MLIKRRLISFIVTAFMICSYLPVAEASESNILFSEGFNSSPTNSAAPSNISFVGGDDVKVTDISKSNKALEFKVGKTPAKLSFPATASTGTVWYGIRMKMDKSFQSGALFQLSSSSGDKLNLININNGTGLYDGKRINVLRINSWIDLRAKLNYDKKTVSVYLNSKIVMKDWLITDTIPAVNQISFEFSNTDRTSTIAVDHIIAYTGDKYLSKYPAQVYNNETIDASESATDAEKIPRVYLFEDFNASGFNATALNLIPYNHIIEVRNLQNREYAIEGDRMYLHMERLNGVSGFPYFRVPIKDFDAKNYVIDMTLNIFELSGMGFELFFAKDNVKKSSFLLAEENGIIKCGGDVFNQFDYNKWNRLSLVVNALSSSIDVYVNGDLVKEGLIMSGDISDINQICFQHLYGNGKASMGLDVISVYEGDELKPALELDNFTNQYVNRYETTDISVNSFIGDKGVFCLNNSAFYKDGKKVKFDDKGYETFSGIPMGSVKAMAEAYAVSYSYDSSTKTATLGNGAILKVGSDRYILNGNSINAGSVIEEKDGVVFAPAVTFFEKLLGKTVSYNSDWLILYLSDDGTYVSTQDATMMREVMYKMIYDRPSGEDMAKKIAERFPNNSHPRTLFNNADIERVKKYYQTDKYSKQLFENLKMNADSILETKPVEFSMTGAQIDLARTREDRITDLGIIYHITGDERYADRGIEELQKMVEMPYLGWGNALTSGAIMSAFARGYDMFYDRLSPELKTRIEDCVISLWERDLLDGSNATGDRNFNYMNANMNWVPVHNGPYLESSFVFADNPRMAEYAKKQFEISQRSLEGSMALLAPDGACPEGAGYWIYTFLEWAPAVKAMQNSLGTTLGFEDHLGVEKGCYFLVDLLGKAGLNLFHDSGTGKARSSRKSLVEQSGAVYLIADLYQDSGLLSSFNSNIDNFLMSGNGIPLMWYNPELMSEKSETQLDNRYRGELDYVAFNSSRTDENGIIISAHSGENNISHSHIDGGTYVLDAMGLNWVCDIGTESYSVDYSPIKGKYYSTRPEAHNVYLINPRADYQGQDIYASGSTIEFETTDKGGYAIIDMSKYYEADVITAQRGIKLTGNRSYALVRDEMTLKGYSDIISFIHTQADIEILDNNRAIFKQFGKKLLVEVETNGNDLTLEEMACEMLPTSPKTQPDAKDTSEYRKLAMKLTGSGTIAITVKFTPLYDERITSTKIDDTALALWEPEAGVNDAPSITAVYADDKLAEGFEAGNKLVRIPVAKDSARLPAIRVECDERYTAEIIKSSNDLLTDAVVIVSEKANPENISYYTIRFEPEATALESLDGYKLADIKSVISEDTGANLTSILTDRNFATEKYEGTYGREYLIDLGSVQNIDSVITAFGASSLPYKYIYDIECSEDGVNFVSKTGIWSLGTSGYEAVKLGEDVKARYIRIIANGRTGAVVSRLCEVAVAVK